MAGKVQLPLPAASLSVRCLFVLSFVKVQFLSYLGSRIRLFNEIMHKLVLAQYPQAEPIFRPLTAIHCSLAATLAGDAPGEVWLDDLDQPRVGYAVAPEGCYLAGDPQHSASYSAMQAIIAPDAYLIVHPAGWEAVLSQIWRNAAARRHDRLTFRCQTLRLPAWRSLLPSEFDFVPIDQPFLQRTELKNHAAVIRWIGGWHSPADFLTNGLGFCILRRDVVAAMCLMDCCTGNRCEIGIRTAAEYRRQGLAAVVVAGMVEACLACGIHTIGWHCLHNNRGSRRTAEKVGFALLAEYAAYSSSLPAENLGDLTPTEAQVWARHYEAALTHTPHHRLDAAVAWALAGEAAPALAHLGHAVQEGQEITPDWLQTTWVFTALRPLAEFQAIVAKAQKSGVH